MTSDARGQSFFPYVFDGFLHNDYLVLLNEVVTGGAMDVYRVSAFVDNLVDAGRGIIFVWPEIDYGLDFAAGFLFVFVDDVQADYRQAEWC